MDNKCRKMENLVLQKLKDSKLSATKWITKLDTLSPLKTLTRGYSLVEKDGEIIKSVNDVKSEDKIDIRFVDGVKEAKIL